MVTPVNNQFVNVVTYQPAVTALLRNSFALVENSNKKFENFGSTILANRGSTVSFRLPTRMVADDTLYAQFNALQDRQETLTVDQAKNVSWAVNDPQRIFNLDGRGWMEEYGNSAAAELGTAVESYIATRAKDIYRFFGDGYTDLTSFGQLANAEAEYVSFGADMSDEFCVYLPPLTRAKIVNSGLNQFTPMRNDEMQASWKIGEFSKSKYYESNLLDQHTAGTVGQGAITLTVVSTDDPTGNNITQITCSGAPTSDADAIKEGDAMQFVDNVSGQPNLRFRTFTGHKVSDLRVQMVATADAASDGAGNVTLTFNPPLSVTEGNVNQNINVNVVAGMQIEVMPSHRVAFRITRKAMLLGMPKMPEKIPYPTNNKTDMDSGVSLRLYYGSELGTPNHGYILDCIYGSRIIPEYGQKLLIPV